MPNPHKVKFKTDGSRCTKNLQKLRRLPECGIFDRDNLPFHPVNPPPHPPPDPKHPFRPFNMAGISNVLNDQLIPDQPKRPNPVFPDESGTLVGGATGPGSQYSAPQLPQDDTNVLLRGQHRVFHEESRFGIKPTFFRPRGYHTVPAELPANYRNEGSPSIPANYRNEIETLITTERRRLQMSDDEVARSQLNLMDDGAGAIPPRPRSMPIGDPRDEEFSTPKQRPPFRKFSRPSRSNGTNGGSKMSTLSRGKTSAPSTQAGIELTNTRVRRGLQANFDENTSVVRQRSDQQRSLGMRNVEEDSPVYPIEMAEPTDVRGTPGRKRNSEYFELETDSPSRYRRPRVSRELRSRATQLRQNIALASQASKFRRYITESLASRSQGVIQGIRDVTTRQFGQGYERVVSDAQSIRMARAISGEQPIGGGRPIEIGRQPVATTDTGDITIRRPVTGDIHDLTGLNEIDLGNSPFDQVIDEPTVIGRSAPKLSMPERLRNITLKNVNTHDAVRGTGAAGVGFLAGMGVASLMGGTDYTGNSIVNASIVGGASGAVGDVAGRTTAAIAQRTLVKTTETVAEESAIAGTLGIALARGAGEGLIIGAVAAPLDLLLNDKLRRDYHFSHAGANAASSGSVGIGTMAAVGAISLAAAPETFGLSLVVAGVVTALSTAIGAFTGHQQDEKERKAREAQERAKQTVISTANARKSLLATLPDHDHNFQDALDAYPNKTELGVGDDTWDAFQTSSTRLFIPRPSNSPAPSPGSDAEASGDQKRMNDLFSKYITHSLIGRVCTGGTDCTELQSRDPGELTSDETHFLNDKTGSTWQPQADMQVEMSVQELQYTQQRIGVAKKQMVDAWNENQTLPNQLDSYIVQTAYLDSKWEDKFNTAIKFDAQDKVIDAYATNQTKLEQMSPNIQTVAGYDPEFSTVMHAYYDDMENTASQLEVDVSQLIELQGLEGEQQRDRYQEMQFNRVKTQEDVVEQAGELAVEQDAVRAAGFYDIDQAFLESDPTDISQWHPSDSQILQAHAAGMNLNQYVAYMHQLALGDAGDYKKLPTYTEQQLEDFGNDDYKHLQSELTFAKYSKDLYNYDRKTRLFTLNPDAPNAPNMDEANHFVSRFTPTYLVKARQDYSDMIHGLNEENQSQVDQYNTTLLRDLQAYGDQYNDMVAAQNEYLMSHAGPVTNLLHYHVDDVFNQYRLSYHPLSDALPTKDSVVIDENIVSADTRRLSEKERLQSKAAQKYGMSVPQYHRVKDNLQRKGVVDATDAQFTQAVSEVKSVAPGAKPVSKG